MTVAFVSQGSTPWAPVQAPVQSPLGRGSLVTGHAPAGEISQTRGFLPAAAAASVAALAISAASVGNRRRATARLVARRQGQDPCPAALRPSFLGRFVAGLRRRVATKAPRAAAEAVEESGDDGRSYAYRMVKIAIVVTALPFLFCLKNFFYNPALSDFDVEYGPHLAHPALRATSSIQAVMVLAAVLWREKNRDDHIDRLFAWLFVPEAVAHIFLHFFSHHWAPANFAFAYAFSAGIALPGFLSLLCYCPKEKKLPWAYLALYMATQIPIVCGLTDMVGPAKMRLNFANINTGWITTPFFYGILKRWKDVPKLPVLLATLTISYQITMGIMGPITGGSTLKLYDPSCIFQHGVVDIGFGFAYAASIICGVFRQGIARPKWT